MAKVTDILNKLEAMEDRIGEVDEKIGSASKPQPRLIGGLPGNQARVPNARRGENIMSSRGFQFGRLFAAKNNLIAPEQCQIELDFCHRHTQKIRSLGYKCESGNSLLVPIWPDAFNDQMVSEEEYVEMKGLLQPADVDPEEFARVAKKFGYKTAATPAQSWVDQSLGGSFVAPPTFGPPIELLRNKQVMLRAGANLIPLGPSGSMTFPRLNSATSASWSGENTQQTPTTAGTGSMSLSAKKVISVVVYPNELLAFGSPATEQLIRNDMFTSVALKMDKGLLEGPGTSIEPLGLVTMATASGNPYQMTLITPANDSGHQLSPEQLYDFISGIQEHNGPEEDKIAYVMRPKLKWAIYKGRASGDGTHYTNNFMFNWSRGPDGKMSASIAGADIVDSVQVSNTRGDGAQTYMLAFVPSDYYVGMFGSIDFFSTDAGYTLLSSDQSAVRVKLWADGAPRHPGLVSFADELKFVVQ